MSLQNLLRMYQDKSSSGTHDVALYWVDDHNFFFFLESKSFVALSKNFSS